MPFSDANEPDAPGLGLLQEVLERVVALLLGAQRGASPDPCHDAVARPGGQQHGTSPSSAHQAGVAGDDANERRGKVMVLEF